MDSLSVTAKIKDNIEDTAFPNITPDVEMLEKTFLEEEITLQTWIQVNFLSDFTIFVQDALTYFLTKTFCAISPSYPFPTQAPGAHVVVIPNLGKDFSSCSGCKPIFIKNIEKLVNSKIIANRLKTLIPDLIHLD